MATTDENIDLESSPEGDKDFFIAVYNKYWYELYMACYRRIKDKAVAEELVQELFLNLLQRRDCHKIDQIKNYLFSSIKYATIDYLKKQMVVEKYRNYKKLSHTDASRSTEEMMSLRDLEESLDKGLSKLSGKSGEIFRLYRIDHWSIEKIARHFGLSEKTVHYHLTKSQKFIRTYLQEFTLILCVLASC